MLQKPIGPAEVTRILNEMQAGHPSAAEQLLPLVYEELRALADSYFRQERPNHTLQPTALVHEAYLRLIGSDVHWQGRAHFVAVAANAMRRILINHAEKFRAIKRGGRAHTITLSENTPVPDAAEFGAVDLLALDEAMTQLEQLDERQCRVVELRFFGGLSVEHTAEILGVSERTVKLDWQMARAWLYNRLKK